MDIIIISVELGLLYSFLSFSVYLSYRVLNYPDLTVDMSSTTSAGTFIVLALNSWNPFLSLIIGMIVAGTAGLTSGFLHKKLNLNPILCGVLTLSIFYTINLRIMGRPNLSLIQHSDFLPFVGSLNNHFSKIIFLCFIVFFIKFFIDFFLATEYGTLARATGNNEDVVRSLGNDPKTVKIVILFVSGMIFGLGAALTAQYQGFIDINGGIGNIIVGIASLMLGEALLKPKKVSGYTLAAIVGAITYELIVNIVLSLGLSSVDLKFFTALVVILAIIARKKEK